MKRVTVACQEFLHAKRAPTVRRPDDDDVPQSRAISSTRRRMNARIRISLNSASVCTRASICSRLSSIASPGSLTRTRKIELRPVTTAHSPENWLRACVAISVSPGSGRTTCRLAARDDKQRDTLVAGVVQHFTERRWAAAPVGRHSADLRRRQRRKRVLRVDNGGLQQAHRRIARVHGFSGPDGHRTSSITCTGPSSRISPMLTARSRCRNAYCGTAVSKRGSVRK